MFIDESCELVIATVDYQPKVKISFNKRLKETKDLNDKIVDINNIVDVKGDKAKGNQLTRLKVKEITLMDVMDCLLYTSPSPRDGLLSRMPSSA